jgi:hypothetical protein
MDVTELALALERLGCPRDQSDIMARQLDRRACMDADRKGVSYESALQHLVSLMAQGWAATGKPSRAVDK